jgi:nuclear pore complex protein Nup160
VLELVEHSLDVNLVGNNIRYKFQDTPVLEGLTIHETYNSIVVLVATVSSVHRLSFPHPDKIHKQVQLIRFVRWLLSHYMV